MQNFERSGYKMIAGYCAVKKFSASSKDIALTSHPHPTRLEALRQAAMSVIGHPTQS